MRYFGRVMSLKRRGLQACSRTDLSRPTSESNCKQHTPCASLFIRRFLIFIGLIVPSTFVLALLATPAKSIRVSPSRAAMVDPIRDGCEHMLTEAVSRVAAMQARLKHFGDAHGPETCHETRLFFLEEVKERAVTAVCMAGVERERQLGRLDAGVEQANNAIAANCAN